MVRRVGSMVAITLLTASIGCGQAVTPDPGASGGTGGMPPAGGDGGGGTGGKGTPPPPDACEDVPFVGESCCDAGCAPSTSPTGEWTCVDLSRHCYFKKGSDVWEEPCPPGYVCALGYGTNTQDPCNNGEFEVATHGFCYWAEEEDDG